VTDPASIVDRPCSLREQKKQQTRQAIQDAASRLVTQRGLPHVTVADICADATVSERTFFNYFPSKAAAALGLPDTALAPHDEERFLSAEGRLVDDVCVLVADAARLHQDQLPRIRELIRLEPDLQAALNQWSVSLRERIVRLAEQRTSPERARLVVALVFAAAFLHADSGYTTRNPTAPELRATIARLASMADEGVAAAVPDLLSAR
jgi:AcrR family transcriptional regulator